MTIDHKRAEFQRLVREAQRVNVTLIVLFSLLCPAGFQTAKASQPVHQNPACEKIAATDLRNLEEAPTVITSARALAADGNTPPHCHAIGYVNPSVGFELLLPIEGWNGKFIHIGSGGHGGIAYTPSCTVPLKRGYACIVSDMGHRGMGSDAIWASNNLQAKVDWGYRATHVATLAGKAITAQFYGRVPFKSYFAGCSTGGRQGLQAAQRFPWDFDGIIAGAPPIRLADLYVTGAWMQRVAYDRQGKSLLSAADLKLLTSAALAKCDMDDGVKDNVIGAPLACPFRPSSLACRPSQTADCLGPDQIRAAQQIYDGPRTSSGKSLFGGGAVPGSEYGAETDEWAGGWHFPDLAAAAKPDPSSILKREGLRALFFSPERPPEWALDQFDFESDYKRLDVMQSLYDASNPDLSRFKAAGGKLLLYHGMNDTGVLPHWIIDYYRKVELVMGGREQTQDFARLFSLPGVEHCHGGAGADVVDYLTALERWVEQDQAPDKLIAYHLKPTASPQPAILGEFPLATEDIFFSRPAYPYPLRARYDGHGDPNKAESFRAIMSPPGE